MFVKEPHAMFMSVKTEMTRLNTAQQPRVCVNPAAQSVFQPNSPECVSAQVCTGHVHKALKSVDGEICNSYPCSLIDYCKSMAVSMKYYSRTAVITHLDGELAACIIYGAKLLMSMSMKRRSDHAFGWCEV